MGQYYRAVIINDQNKPVLSGCAEFLKLREHGWMKNDFVRMIEAVIMRSPSRLVWAGDYAEKEPASTLSMAEIKPHVDEKHSAWTLEALKRDGINLYQLSKNVAQLKYEDEVILAPLSVKYLINHDKKQYVDKTKVPCIDGWAYHPLPFLTAEGNGQGSGDYRGEDPKELIGSWARNLISATTKKSDIPNDYFEVVFDLFEE